LGALPAWALDDEPPSEGNAMPNRQVQVARR
jgi:hypothetical protein